MALIRTWPIRLAIAIAIVFGYRAIVDIGPTGSVSHTLHLVALCVLFATAETVFEVLRARRARGEP